MQIQTSDTLSVFDLPVRNVSMDAALDLIENRLERANFSPVYFINAHCVNVAFETPQYAQSLRRNDLNFADGVGMKIAVRSQGESLRDNVNGTDMFPLLCKRLAGSPVKVFLLGGEPGVAEQLADTIADSYGPVNIVGVHHGHFPESQYREVAEQVRSTGAELVLVAMGVPRQELWIEQCGEASGAKVLMAVGGLFNFYSGRIPRAPKWMRKCGLEWLHRLIQEPKRMWRRYLLGNAVFLARVAFAKITPTRSGWLQKGYTKEQTR